MKKILLTILLAQFLTFLGFEAAQAALLEVDDPVFGVKSITRDTKTGLEWLDLTLTYGQSYNYVSSQFKSGGIYEGFRYAKMHEVKTFWVNAGIPDICDANCPSSANYLPIKKLQNLIGVTEITEDGKAIKSQGIIADKEDDSLASFVMRCLPRVWIFNNIGYADLDMVHATSDEFGSEGTGSYLVRPFTSNTPPQVGSPNPAIDLLLKGIASKALLNANNNIGKTSGTCTWDGVTKYDRWADGSITYCAVFTRMCFGRWTGKRNAIDVYNFYKNLGLVKTGTIPPKGAVVFYAKHSSNWFYGHVGIATDDAKLISATSPTTGVNKTAIIGYFAAPYLGYVTADDFVNNW